MYFRIPSFVLKKPEATVLVSLPLLYWMLLPLPLLPSWRCGVGCDDDDDDDDEDDDDEVNDTGWLPFSSTI